MALGLALALGPAAARGAEGSSPPEGRERCPGLFGGKKTRTKNRVYRKRMISFAVEEPSGITVAHSHRRWREPRELEVKGLELVSIDDGRAVVQVSDKLGRRMHCPAGRYLLQRDDAVGRRTSVLALFDDVVLVVHRGRLSYISVSDAEDPRWLMAWRLPGATVYPSQASKGRRPPPAARRRPPPKARPKPRPKPRPRRR